MKHELFKDQDAEMRKQLLSDNAVEVTMGNYTRHFSATEKNIHRKRICDIEIQLNEIEEEVKQFRDEIKDRKDPLMSEKRKLIDEIKAGGEFVRGKLYKIIDRENQEVGFYNEDGELVEMRRLTREDNQVHMNEYLQASNM